MENKPPNFITQQEMCHLEWMCIFIVDGEQATPNPAYCKPAMPSYKWDGKHYWQRIDEQPEPVPA